jgi:deoxyribonuclease V
MADDGRSAAHADDRFGKGGPQSPIAIVDVHYETDRALCAAIVAQQWTDAAPCEEKVLVLPGARPYRPGAFFERELPGLVAALTPLQTAFRTIVIDGYAVLDGQGRPGLGAHLHAHFAGAFTVVGVAKSAYRGCDVALPVRRGESRRPLFVTAIGTGAVQAARCVQEMHGSHRLPTLIARVDRLARSFSRC